MFNGAERDPGGTRKNLNDISRKKKSSSLTRREKIVLRIFLAASRPARVKYETAGGICFYFNRCYVTAGRREVESEGEKAGDVKRRPRVLRARRERADRFHTKNALFHNTRGILNGHAMDVNARAQGRRAM